MNTLKNLFFVFCLCFVFANVATGQTKKSDVANPANFQKLETTNKVNDCRSTLKRCGERALVALDLAGFGGPDSLKFKTENFWFRNGVAIFLQTTTGIKDPLIAGERTRLSFKRVRGRYRFVQAGKQYLCVSDNKWKKACAPAGTQLSEVKSADLFRFMSVNGQAAGAVSEPCQENLLECGQKRVKYYVSELPERRIDEVFEFESFDEDGKKKITGVYLLTDDAVQDDSISGMRYRFEFVRRNGVWEFVGAGRQQRCARGEAKGRWIITPCA